MARIAPREAGAIAGGTAPAAREAAAGAPAQVNADRGFGRTI